MSGELVKVEGVITPNDPDDEDEPLDEVALRAYRLAGEWLNGMAVAATRNAYAIDIGLPGRLRVQMPGGPRSAKKLPEEAWIPWALANGINPIGELDLEEAEAYAHFLLAVHPKRKNVRRRRWFTVCSFQSYLRRRKLIYITPNDLIDRQARKNLGLAGSDPTRTIYLTTMQVQAMNVAARLDRTRFRERNVALLAVLGATGCRAEELVNLDLEDYHRQSPTGGALVLLDGKGDKKRWQKLPAKDADLVDAYLAVRIAPEQSTELTLPGQVSNRPKMEHPLFTTGPGQRLNVDAITQLLRRIANLPTVDDHRPLVRAAALELAPIKDTVTPHPWRHAYAVAADRNGVPVTQIQADLGHASLSTTQTYLHAANVAENSAAQVVSDLYHAADADLAQLITQPNALEPRTPQVDERSSSRAKPDARPRQEK
jgi:site-specific recombinase XerD